MIGPAKSGKRYFPASFGEPAQVCNFKGYPECFATINEIENEWYPKYWEAAGEPSLYELSLSPRAEDQSTLRFTWLPSFHHPVIVRFERSGEKVKLIAKQLSGEGGYEPGKIGRSVARELSKAEIARLDSILSQSDVLDQRATNCDLGVDGSQWIVESADQHGYRFINRWAPSEGPVRSLGDFALNLTGWKFDEVY